MCEVGNSKGLIIIRLNIDFQAFWCTKKYVSEFLAYYVLQDINLYYLVW